MITATYVLQGASIFLMGASGVFCGVRIAEGRYSRAGFNALLFVINLGLFLWQAYVRSQLS